METLIAAGAAFTGTHLVLSHPLRRPLVRGLGEGGFRLVYSAVALGTLIWVVNAWRAAPASPLWTAPRWAWHVAPIVMAVAAILFVGSLTPRNAALAGTPGATRPTGALLVTRHPMMWSFALWAAVHAWLAGTAATFVLALSVGGLALVGAALQDGKKRAADAGWARYERQTSFVPFARGRIWPGWVAVLGGIALLLVATWAHPRLGAPPVPPWVWPN